MLLAACAWGRADAQTPTAAVLTGRVRFESGASAVDASVALQEAGLATRTDATGRFRLTSSSGGTFTLVITGSRITTLRRAVALTLGDTSRVELTVLRAAGTDTAHLLPTVLVRRSPPTAVGALPATRGTEIFSGKKTEVVLLDSMTVNAVQDVTRQVLGRVPGLNVTETENSGFPSNGIGFRGLNPVQSVEMNVRQNGVNIVADLYGYPETYYTPPAEAVQRVEFVRGSSSLQFGPQFGGVVDYELRGGTPDTGPQVSLTQSGGSFGLFNSYLSLTGGTSKWTYFGYAQYRGQQGWRPNSELRQVSGAARARYQANDKLRVTFEYSLLRNYIQMPGGLDDEQFDQDSRSSFRARNWLASPWNIGSATAELTLSPSTKLTSTLSTMFSQRYLVWRNEDGGPAAIDTIDPATDAFTPREVEREYFFNITNETRLLSDYSLFGGQQTVATGFRILGGRLHRQEGGTGTTGSDFDMSLVTPYETDVTFGTTNVAVFAENIFRVGSRLSITPGVRAEYLQSTASGHTDTTVSPPPKSRTFALAGIGARLEASPTSDVYANITQAYRPIEYSFLTPFASLTRVDPNLKDPRGYNADLGWRGTLGLTVAFDLGAFYLSYHNRIGLISGVDSSGAPFTERTNVANSVHQGVEAYVEVSPLTWVGMPESWGTVKVFDALGYVHARYTTGEFAGNRVEFAPEVVNRAGASYARGRLSTSVQWSYTSKQFSDANNTVAGADATVGIIPAYQVVDWSAKVGFSHGIGLGVGINNIADHRYFTMRTTEYPGPGIIPAIGRSFYASLSAGF